MRMRNDVCVDSFVLSMFERQTFGVEADRPAVSVASPSSASQMVPLPSAEATEEPSSSGSSHSSSSSAAPPKESLLVQISNRVKLLERNATAAGSWLRQLNASLLHQADDMEHILEAVIRAKDTFKGSLEEQVTVRSRLKALSEQVQQFEMLIEESSQTVKLLMATLLLVGVAGLYLICSLVGGAAASPLGAAPKHVVTKEAATMTDRFVTAKKVVFVSLPPVFDTHFGRGSTVGKKPSRRVTWCGGRSTADNAADKLVEETAEDINLEDEILKSILKKAKSSPSFHRGGQLPNRRVTWCGGHFSRDSEQLGESRAREI